MIRTLSQSLRTLSFIFQLGLWITQKTSNDLKVEDRNIAGRKAMKSFKSYEINLKIFSKTHWEPV